MIRAEQQLATERARADAAEEREARLREEHRDCRLALEFRDAASCGGVRRDDICHNHTIIAAMRKHAVDADRFELELRAANLRESRLREVTAAFVRHHDNGQAGKPGFPRTYREVDVWQAEWDRLYAEMSAALAGTPEIVPCAALDVD